MTTASKGASEKRKLTQYVTNTVLDSQFRGTSQQFFLHFNEQFRRLDELTDLAEKIPESIKGSSFRMQSRTSLNSVLLRPLMNTPLRLLEQVLVPSLPIHPITTCSSMLVLYDETNTSIPSKRRNVYTAAGAQDLNAIEQPHKVHFDHDIDTPSDDFYPVHQAKQGKPPPTPLSGFQRNHARKPTPSTIKKPFKKYDGPVYVPVEVYKLLSPEAVTALKKYNSEAINKLLRKGAFMSLTLLTMNQPHLRIPCMRNKLTPFIDDATTNEFDPILDYINSQHHQEEDMNHTLEAYNVMASPTPNDTPQWSINSVHIHLLYHVAKQNKFNMVHLWIGVLMVALQALV